MRFNKQNARMYGSRGGKARLASHISAKPADELKQQLEQEAKAFEAFEVADAGDFDGFEMATIFHLKFDKADAIEVLTADDCADATTSAGAVIHVGADGVRVYIMTESARFGSVKKIVQFNRSVYVF